MTFKIKNNGNNRWIFYVTQKSIIFPNRILKAISQKYFRKNHR